MQNAGGIFYEVDARTAALVRSQRTVKRSTNEITKDFDRTGKAGERLNTSMTRVAKAIAGVFAVRQIQRFVLSTAQAIDEQGKFAQQLGVSFAELQKLQFAAEQSGASITQLNNSLRRGRRNIADAAEGTGSAVDALAELNLEARELTRLSPDEQFRVLADAISGVEDEARQAAIAYRIFGRDGEFLLNTLRQGRDGLAELGDEAERSGRILSDQAAADAAKFNDELNKLRGAARGAAVSMGSDLLPAITDVITAFTDFIADGDKVQGVISVLGFAAQATAVVLAGRFIASIYASITAMNIAAIGARTLTAALAFLGGPVGVLAAVVASLGLVAWHATRAKNAQDDLRDSTDLLEQSYDKLTRTQQRQMLTELAAEIAKLEEETESAAGAMNTFAQNDLLGGMDTGQVQDLIGYLDGSKISAEEAGAAITRSGENAAIALEKKQSRLQALRDMFAELNEVVNRSTDSQDENNQVNEEAARVLTNLAQRNEELRAEIDGTTEALEIRRAIQAAGVDADSAEANVIAELIRQNREYTQAIRDRAEADEEARNLRAQFDTVSGDAQNENMSESERLQAQLDERMAIIEEAKAQELVSEEEFEAAKQAIRESYLNQQKELETRRQSLMLGSAAAIFGDMSDIVKTFGNEQSGIYKGLFAASKAFSIAQSIVAIKTGIAQAAALPFPTNLGAMATVAAQTAGIVSDIKGTNMGGGRLRGGVIEPGVIYPVTEDGRPELFTAQGKDYMVSSQRGRMTGASALEGRGGSGGSVAGDVNFTLQVQGGMDNRQQFENMLFDSEPLIGELVERYFQRQGREI